MTSDKHRNFWGLAGFESEVVGSVAVWIYLAIALSRLMGRPIYSVFYQG